MYTPEATREELALAIAHEMSHNILHHIENAMFQKAEWLSSDEYRQSLNAVLDSKYERLSRLKKTFEGYTFSRSRHQRYRESEAMPDLPPGEGASSADPLVVLYTSGSSSRPKAVPLDHGRAIENAFNIGERQGLVSGDRILVSIPLFWSYGAVNALPAAITHGATLVLQGHFEPGGALDLIEQHKCTAIYTLPAIIEGVGGRFSPEIGLGVLSLIFWALIVTVSVKYCLFVMRADNHGEGGILALMSLVAGRGS